MDGVFYWPFHPYSLLDVKGGMKMLAPDKVFNAQMVQKIIIWETNAVRAYGIAPECEL